MSAKLMPIPVGTPFAVDASGQMPIPWIRHLKAIGDDLLTANKVIDAYAATDTAKAYPIKYVINANICAFVYAPTAAATSDLTINLPYTALLAFQVGSTVYPAGTKAITIPANTAFAQAWYVVSWSN